MAFTSVILRYPKKLVEEINTMVDSGKTSEDIRNHITINYTKKLKGNIPDLFVIDRYITWRKELLPNLTSLKNSDSAIQVQSPQSTIIDIPSLRNKKEMLDALISTSYERIKRIDAETSKQIDPRLEGHLRAYVEEIRKTIEILAKMSGELEEDSNITVNLVNEKLMVFTSILQSTIMEVCPEKAAHFLNIFKRNFTAFMQQVKETNKKETEEVINITPSKDIK